MTVTSDQANNMAHGSPSDAEALYRQGMAHYRAREWSLARECFGRLRALAPERRGTDGLINELDHFIRLEEVRPVVARQPNVVIVADASPAPQTRRRVWMLVIPAILVVLVVSSIAATGTGMFAQGASPSPSLAPQAVLLTARSVSGPVRLATAGTDIWQDWSNSRLLAVRDRIRMGEQGMVEFTLADGKVVVLARAEATLDIEQLAANGEATLGLTDGRIQVQADSSLLHIITPFLDAQVLKRGTVFWLQVTSDGGQLAASQGEVLVTASDSSMVIGSGDEVTAGRNRPAVVQRQATPGASPAVVPTAVLSPTPWATATAAPTQTRTATASATPTATRTPTLAASPTVSPTATPVPPTHTATPVAAPTTPVPVPRTATPIPPTSTPPPTNTPVPPTATRIR